MSHSRKEKKLVLEICDEAIELKPQEREAFLDRMCGDDLALKRAAKEILQAVQDSGEFLRLHKPR